MDAQQVIALAIVGIAAFLLLWRQFRPRRFRLGRDTPCGCSSPRAGNTPPAITFRAHRNGRREIIVHSK